MEQVKTPHLQVVEMNSGDVISNIRELVGCRGLLNEAQQSQVDTVLEELLTGLLAGCKLWRATVGVAVQVGYIQLKAATPDPDQLISQE